MFGYINVNAEELSEENKRIELENAVFLQFEAR